MAYIKLKNVYLEYPIYNTNTRSLSKRMLNWTTGGRITHDSMKTLTVKALEDVSFEFMQGDRVALLGHNGAGKTSLLRVLAGIYEPHSGDVFTVGRIAPLFGSHLGIDLDCTGYENIFLRGLHLGMSPSEIKEKTEEIAQFTDLGNYLQLPVRTYSSGMQMRLAFAISTSINPEILLMDEWFGVADAAFVESADKRLRNIVHQAGLLVLASHNEGLLKQICNKGILLQHGRVLCSGEFNEVMYVYKSLQNQKSGSVEAV